ncbi:MAG TPA: 8-oxo-dGTP diphosphatase [Candidatus Saccharimonadales bacterium]|nr:8-oxo-dGTP diphosphatase [Candidatus Saccharimonadales bacterium]
MSDSGQAKVCTLLFLQRENELLLAMKKRGFGANRWNGVGGKVEASETIEQALVRECQEEIAVTPTEYHKVAINLFHEFHEGQHADMEVHVYLCTAWEGEPSESEEMAPYWFNVDSVPYDKMWADDKHWLPAVLAGKQLRAIFNLDANDSIVDFTVTEVVEL